MSRLTVTEAQQALEGIPSQHRAGAIAAIHEQRRKREQNIATMAVLACTFQPVFTAQRPPKWASRDGFYELVQTHREACEIEDALLKVLEGRS